MTYSFIQDVPADAAMYQRIIDGLGPDVPAGLVSHLAIVQPEGGLRYIDVWESEADYDRFVEERLHPVVHGILAEIFGDDLPPEPERTEIDVLHVWAP